MSCRVCGKDLTDPVSVALGIGPICYMERKMKELNSGDSLFADRAVYTVDDDGDFIKIIDLDEGRTVTNDARNVVRDLVKAGYDVDKKIIL